MSENVQNYRVNYAINVDASQGVPQVQAFAEAVSKIAMGKTSLTLAVENVQKMMKEIDSIFKTKNGKPRSYVYSFNIDTEKAEKKLAAIQKLITKLKEKNKSAKLVMNTELSNPAISKIEGGHKNENEAVLSQVKPLTAKQVLDNQKEEVRKTASSSMKSLREIQQSVTKVIGKINAALVVLERGREINIKTDIAKERLLEILALMQQVKGASNMTLGMQMGSPGKASINTPGTLVSAGTTPSPAASKETARSEANILSKAYAEQARESRQRMKVRLDTFNRMKKEGLAALKFREECQMITLRNQLQAEQEQKKNQQKIGESVARSAKQQVVTNDILYGNKRKAALNRLQYTKRFSLRSLPLASMLNAYMAFGFIKSQVTQAIEYNNIMESAHSILKVADTNLGSFEQRFDKMARHVRQIGVETKYTAVEIAGATKYLAMAGLDVETIQRSMRPIANLALIGDNSIQNIADLATNIMTGYNIKNTSMDSIADILASTVSRSNVNVIEVAESFKLAAGYLKNSGIDFSEATAAIGILGNSGIKGSIAGTSLRAMSTRFAKPTKEAIKVLDRLQIKFTHFVDVYGKKVEKLRPLADIFKDLHDAGATMGDLQAIFGKIAGNAATQFMVNYQKLKELTTQNKVSHGIASELALVKQNTTKGLWYQMSSRLTETFMQGYELIEPILNQTLRKFLDKFSTPQLARGLAGVCQALLDIISAIASLGAWVTRNFNWIEPLLFSGFVSAKLFKLAGSITNLGVAVGFLGKQSAATSTLQLVSGLAGMGSMNPKALTFANKRAIVAAMHQSGVTGKGAMAKALFGSGFTGKASQFAARGAFSSIFSQQVAVGNGLVGAGASIAALGSGAILATAGLTGLLGVLGYVAYKTWKLKEAKDAIVEGIAEKRKYYYPSVDALYDSLNKTYTKALQTKKAVDDVTADKTIEEESGQHIGSLSNNWWASYFSMVGAAKTGRQPSTFEDAYQKDVREAIRIIAEKDGQSKLDAAYKEIGQMKSAIEVGALLLNVKEKYGQSEKNLDPSLWHTGANDEIIYKQGLDKMTVSDVAKTKEYADYLNNEAVPKIIVYAQAFRDAISSTQGAMSAMEKGGFEFDLLRKLGFYQDKNNQWQQKELGKNATDEERIITLANYQKARDMLITFTANLRKIFGGSAEAASTIMEKAGFNPSFFGNEPETNDKEPFNANNISYNRGDDGGAGGNYSGTGKLSSAAPKQVIVNISNLLSIATVDLLKSPEGQRAEIQNLKDMMAEALIDTVHDFDASWNG